MPVEIATNRGVYRLVLATPLEYQETDVLLTLAMERADGVERFVTRCRVPVTLIERGATEDLVLDQLKDRFAKDFEAIREASLKAIRSEQRLHEFVLA